MTGYSKFVVSLAVSGTNLFAATYDGLWRRPFSEMNAVQDPRNNLPACFALKQNYPNPFNPTTVITYQLPVNGHVTLKVYDVLGREVRTLVDESKSAGRHEVKFDATDLANGICFCRVNIQVNDGKTFVSTKKMVLMK